MITSQKHIKFFGKNISEILLPYFKTLAQWRVLHCATIMDRMPLFGRVSEKSISLCLCAYATPPLPLPTSVSDKHN